MRRLALLSLLAVAAVAVGQGFRNRPDTTVVVPDDVANTYHLGPYNATTGALFDAGYNTNSLGTNAYPASIEGAAALLAAECEYRMVHAGANNALSNVFTVLDDASGRRVSKVIIETAMLDAGALVSVGGNASGSIFWRPISGGDAGMPWMRVNPNTVISLGVAQVLGSHNDGRTVSILNVGPTNGTTQQLGEASAWAPGYYCLIPEVLTQNLVGNIWIRINRVFEPR